MNNEWRGFTAGNWTSEIDVADFIHKNFTPYTGDDSFLEGPTEATTKLWDEVSKLKKAEIKKKKVKYSELHKTSSI